ncbi:MAG TPA: peptidyl-prolyl cis-trans isomerase [Terriglobales bacterium]|nr:peptidyl-prolyl cis-trans isomerase [Terriglobales bacterium]
MIRFLQTPGPIKKIVLGGLLTVICVLMAITLIPGFGSSSFMGNASSPNVVATVAGDDITANEVDRQTRQMLQQQFPRGGAQAASLRPFFAGQAADRLINERILVSQARNMGLRATDDDVRQYLHQGQLGQEIFPNGTFIGQAAYEDFVSRAFDYTIPQFEELVKQDILVTKLRDLVTSSATVSESDVRKQFEKDNTKVKFDYAVIKKDDVLKSIHPTDTELKAFYEQNKRSYVNSIPEKRQLKYVVLDNAKLLAQVQVTQQELKDYYDQHREQYRVPEQVDVRHILIKTPAPGADGKVDPKAVDAARAKAEDVLKQVKAGGNFAELAKKYSEDTDSAKKGGSLGTINPDSPLDPAFEKAAFALPKGGTSDLVQSSYGFHIIHVDDKTPAHFKSLDEVKSQIEPLIKQQKAGQAAQREADQILSEARGSSLEKAAAAKGLQVITTDFVDRNSLLPGIGSDPQFMTSVFSQEQGAPPDEAQLHQGYAVYQVTAIKPPSTPTFEEAKSRVEQEFKNQRATQLLSQKTQELADRAKADHDLKKAAKELGAEYKTSDFVTPDGQVPDIGSMTGGASVAFTLKPGEISGPVNSGNNGAVLKIDERQAPSDQEYAAKKDQVRETLLQQKQAEAFNMFLSDLRSSMQKAGKIKINEKELATLTKSRNEESE